MKSNAKDVDLLTYDDFFKDDEMREEEKQERVQEIPLSQIQPYARQPYTISRPTPDLVRLMDSIEERGISEPLIVRPLENDRYEIISGHRRSYCAEKLGITEVPVIIRELSDDEADILVADYNITREDLLPSEKAKAYKLRLDAMKHQGKRTDLISLQSGEKLTNKTSVSILSSQVNENVTTIQRYIRLNKLDPQLLDYVDEGKIKLVTGADYLSAIPENKQKWLLDIIDRDEVFPSSDQAKRMKAYEEKGKLTEQIMYFIMDEEKSMDFKVTFQTDELRKYFKHNETPKQMKEVMGKALQEYFERHPPEKKRGMER